jgi:putative flippase GtrA
MITPQVAARLWTPAALWYRLNSEGARPLRFAMVGGSAGLLQLLLLHELVRWGLWSLPANAIAIVISAEVNCALSFAFTWRGSRAWTGGIRRVAITWGRFHAAISVGMGINLAAFAVVRLAIPVTLAGAVGILAAAIWNYLANSVFTFHPALIEPVVPAEPAA